MPERLHNRLLWAAHLLSIFLLPGVFGFLLYRGKGGNVPLYVFWTWEKLALLLPFWVAGRLLWRLWQRRWGPAVALALLAGIDVLVLVGYYFAFFASSMTADSSWPAQIRGHCTG